MAAVTLSTSGEESPWPNVSSASCVAAFLLASRSKESPRSAFYWTREFANLDSLAINNNNDDDNDYENYDNDADDVVVVVE